MVKYTIHLLVLIRKSEGAGDFVGTMIGHVSDIGSIHQGGKGGVQLVRSSRVYPFGITRDLFLFHLHPISSASVSKRKQC